MSTEIQDILFDDLEYVQEHVLVVMLNSILKYNVKTLGRDAPGYVICGSDRDLGRKFLTYSTEDFCLTFNGKSLTVSALDYTVDYDSIPENVSEEWFFQLSTTRNFGSLLYEDIELVKTLFYRRYAGE
jgi:hypothetical protein